MSLPFRVANAVMAVVFFFVVFVVKDLANSLPWMILYGLAAVASIRVAAKRRGWFLATAVGAVALGWAVMHVPRVVEAGLSLDALGEVQTTSTLGLVLVVVWMFVLAFVFRPRTVMV